MKTHFPRYQRFLEATLIAWLLLAIARVFGFDFGLNLLIFFKVFLLLVLVLVILETKKEWPVILPILKSFWEETKNWFSASLEQYPTSTSKVIHSFPLVLRFLWQGLRKNVFFKDILLALCVFGVLFDIFVFEPQSDFIILVLTGLWAWSVWLQKLEGRISIGGGLIFLAMCPFLLIFQKELIAEKAAIWAYMFLLVGVGQMFIEYIKEKRY